MFFIFIVLFLISIPALLNALKEFRRDKLNRDIEKTMPDVLLVVSNLPQSVSFDKIIETAAGAKVVAAIPFRKTAELIKRGAPVETAFCMAFSSYPLVVRKAGDLIAKTYSNGNSTLAIVKQFAVELSEVNASREQTKADASMQKYSLLAASAFLVPFIIALISGVSMQASTLIPNSQPAVSIAAINFAINSYLLVFSFLSAKFIARQFATPFLPFFAVTAPLSLLGFNLSLLFLQ
ncbi:MAG: hypothetical protein V1722_00645 [Candidatus Micrarchaeota archaeon]